MLVGIEASAAVESQRSGVGNYVAHLIAGLRQLGEQSGDLDLILYSNRTGTASANADACPQLPSVYERDHMKRRMVWMQFGLPRSIVRTEPDLCHFPNHMAPVLRHVEVPYVVTMHDMSVFRCPQYHTLKLVTVLRASISAVARRTRLIVTVSESARQDIIHYLKVPPERVRVVYEGISPQFREQSPLGNGPLEVRARYGLDDPYVVTVGTLEPRKNHAGLINAFAQLVREERLPHQLVIVGARGWKEGAIMDAVRTSGVADRIHLLGYVPNADLPGLYRAADAFAFPSWYEGFGLPVLEALSCGVPSLISNDPALCEVAGKGSAVVVDPHSVEDIAAGLFRLLTDDALRMRLRLRGSARAREFSWDSCAAETNAIYQEVLGSTRAPVRRYRTG